MFDSVFLPWTITPTNPILELEQQIPTLRFLLRSQLAGGSMLLDEFLLQDALRVA
jgi:hypothetical protein